MNATSKKTSVKTLEWLLENIYEGSRADMIKDLEGRLEQPLPGFYKQRKIIEDDLKTIRREL